MNKTKKLERTEKSKYYKHPTYKHVYGIKTLTAVGYLAWPYLVKPQEGMENPATKEKSPPRYGVTILLKKDDAKTRMFKEEVESMIEEMLELYNDGNKAKLTGLEVLKNGDEFDHETYPMYKNRWLVVARNVNIPNMIGLDKDPKGEYVPVAPEKFLAGVQVRAAVTPLITAHGVSFKLEDIQFVRDDGTRFGGAPVSSKSLFDADSADLTEDVTDDEMTLAEAAERL